MPIRSTNEPNIPPYGSGGGLGTSSATLAQEACQNICAGSPSMFSEKFFDMGRQDVKMSLDKIPDAAKAFTF
jgi:hypothetical protein